MKCPIHPTEELFQKGKMREPAHPIKDSSGNEIKVNGKSVWCDGKPKNDPPHPMASVPQSQQPTPKVEKPTPDYAAIQRESIERQTALKASVEWGIAEGCLDTPLGIIQMAEQFYQWIHNGVIPAEPTKETIQVPKTPPESKPTPETRKMRTPAQVEKLKELAKTHNINALGASLHVDMTKALSEVDAGRLIEACEKGV